jgi:hypothetical protein
MAEMFDVECVTCGKSFQDTCRFAKYCSDACIPRLLSPDPRTCMACERVFQAEYLGQVTCLTCVRALPLSSDDSDDEDAMNRKMLAAELYVHATLVEMGYDVWSRRLLKCSYPVLMATRNDQTRLLRARSGFVSPIGLLHFNRLGFKCCTEAAVWVRNLRRTMFFPVDDQGTATVPYDEESPAARRRSSKKKRKTEVTEPGEGTAQE